MGPSEVSVAAVGPLKTGMGRRWTPEASLKGQRWALKGDAGPKRPASGVQNPVRGHQRLMCALTAQHGALRGQNEALKDWHGPALNPRGQQGALKGQDGPSEADAGP